MTLVLGKAELLDEQNWLPKERTRKKVIAFIWAWVGTGQVLAFRKPVGLTQGHEHSAWGPPAAARLEDLAQGWVHVSAAWSRAHNMSGPGWCSLLPPWKLSGRSPACSSKRWRCCIAVPAGSSALLTHVPRGGLAGVCISHHSFGPLQPCSFAS